jgi:Fe-S-cluster containining protein
MAHPIPAVGTTNGNGSRNDNGNGLSAETLRSVVAELDRQVERGSLFTQAALHRGFVRLNEAEHLLGRLIEALADKGVVSPEELGLETANPEAADAEEAATVTEGDQPGDEYPPEAPEQPRLIWPAVALRVDDDPDAQSAQPEVLVDCEARMPICQAVCCKLKFPLSAPEVESRKVKWDIGHPYVIRHESSGYCTHNDPETRRCGVYADRPRICRTYSCARDTRIWADFDNMVLNQEWIDQNLGQRDIRLEAVVPTMEIPVELTTKPASRGGDGRG